MTDWNAKYFKSAEFACKCGTCGGRSEMVASFVERLDRLRERFGRPIAISSGFRCERHPSETAKTGGIVGAHRQGRAVDIPCAGPDAFKLMAIAHEVGMTGVGISQRAGQPRFIHLDDAPPAEGQPRPTCWSY